MRLPEATRQGIYASAFGAFFSAGVRRRIDQEKRLDPAFYNQLGEDADSCAQRAVDSAVDLFNDTPENPHGRISATDPRGEFPMSTLLFGVPIPLDNPILEQGYDDRFMGVEIWYVWESGKGLREAYLTTHHLGTDDGGFWVDTQVSDDEYDKLIDAKHAAGIRDRIGWYLVPEST